MAPQLAWFYLLLMFLIALGAVIGSFLNVCIYRLPLEKSIVWPGSHCPVCLRPVRARDNIPILSWFILGGRCRDCGESFSPRYMFVEALTAAIFATLFWIETQRNPPSCLRWCYLAFLCSGLIVATFIDFDHYIIPDFVTVPLMLMGLAVGAAWPQLRPLSLMSVLPKLHRAPPLELALYAIGVSAGVVLLCAWIAWLWQRRRHTLPGAAEWIILAVWSVFIVFQATALLSHVTIGQIPRWVHQVAEWRGFWTGIVGFLVGSGTIWLVRVLAAGFLNWKRRSIARKARKWRRLNSVADRAARRRGGRQALDDPGYFYAWKVIIVGAPRIDEWKRLGPTIAREGMGFGDVTLMAAVGSFLGWQGSLLVFIGAPFLGLGVNLFLVVFRGMRQIPYGPYLSAATLVVLFFWDSLWPSALAWGNGLILLLQLLMNG